MNYIKNDLKGTIPEKYKFPEGRIIITNDKIEEEKEEGKEEGKENNTSEISPEPPKNVEYKMLLLGIGNYKYEKTNNNNMATFNIYFKKSKTFVPKKFIFFTVDIKYSTRLRRLEKVEAKGTLLEEEEDTERIGYNVSIPVDNEKNIEQINSNNDYSLSDDENRASSESPSVIPLSDVNVTDIQDKKEDVNEILFFNVDNISKEPFSFEGDFTKKVTLNKNQIDLIYDEKKEPLNCTINSKSSKYSINCTIKSDISGNFTGAYEYITDIISIDNKKKRNLKNVQDKFYIDNGDNDPVEIEHPTPDDNHVSEDNSFNYKNNKLSSNKHLSGWAIFAIIICCVVVLALTALIFFKSRNVRKELVLEPQESTAIKNLKSI
jgi:hypothetical protein